MCTTPENISFSQKRYLIFCNVNINHSQRVLSASKSKNGTKESLLGAAVVGTFSYPFETPLVYDIKIYLRVLCSKIFYSSVYS